MDETFKKLLRENHLSITQPRLTIFHALLRQSRAISMNELIDACASIDRASIYRIVEQFERIGIVHKVQIGWKYKIELGDSFKDHHHHLTCLSCGASADFEEPDEVDALLKGIEQRHSFTITQHTLELRGLCARCKLKP